jgi:hypothetical protein
MPKSGKKCSRAVRGAVTPKLLVASAIVGVVLLGGVVVSRAAMSWAGGTIGYDSTAARLRDTVERIHDQLADASGDALRAVPAGGRAAEAMVEGVPYDNVEDVETPSRRLRLVGGEPGTRSLELQTAGTTRTLATDLGELTFTRSGGELVVELTTPATSSRPALALTAAVPLR